MSRTAQNHREKDWSAFAEPAPVQGSKAFVHIRLHSPSIRPRSWGFQSSHLRLFGVIKHSGCHSNASGWYSSPFQAVKVPQVSSRPCLVRKPEPLFSTCLLSANMLRPIRPAPFDMAPASESGSPFSHQSCIMQHVPRFRIPDPILSLRYGNG
ncbi:hypothetical protein FA95DRAFT_686827 [Auriscalpium vulgare]|uniref:Uncharacterized protein n=1 Tax=Auriscalpium vulgare TaxID=40419 RepID=A0ACB8S2M6_9AGAM|nr:hypothetical protein FA95DRAFT_686827 [Auriscalpium vulgare]